MYPFLRLSLQIAAWRRRPLDPWGVHVSHHRILPWDLDMYAELNNGLTLTIYDLGRIPFAVRTGAWARFRKADLTLAIAGCAMRYRRRITAFERVEQRTRVAGWDARFIYFDQSLWSETGDCASQGVFRTALVRGGRMVPIETEVLPVLEGDPVRANRPALPDWIAQWSAAESARPWPPEGPATPDGPSGPDGPHDPAGEGRSASRSDTVGSTGPGSPGGPARNGAGAPGSRTS